MIFYTITEILLDATTWYTILFRVLWIVGAWQIFVKCGAKGWHALVPCYSRYELARCANRETEGRVMFGLELLERVLTVVTIVFIINNERVTIMQSVLLFVVDLIRAAYYIRIGIGLSVNFQRNKLWSLVWAALDPIPALIWGFVPKIQPQWRPDDVSSQVQTYFSNSKADVMKDGLTVNLEERTATEMFKKHYLLRDVHMSIAPGHMVLLLGGSGAGKTTLLNAINGYEKAKAEVYLNGSNVYAEYKQMQYQIGFVPQADLMRGKDTVLHTLYDAAALRLPVEFSAADRHKRVAEIMEIFGLTPVKDNLVDKLSGGQRKRLSIAMEFISNPSLFILDEPDSGLDGVMARELMQQLRRIADQSKIVIVITHTPDRVIDLFDDVIVLAKDCNRTGRLAYYGPIDEAKRFFDRDSMEKIVMCINRKEEGGEGRADEFINKFVEVQHG